MMLLDVIDILFMLAGFILGYIFCYLYNRDAMEDVCDECIYCEYLLEVLEHERNE